MIGKSFLFLYNWQLVKRLHHLHHLQLLVQVLKAPAIARAFRTCPVGFLSKTEKADGHREELVTASAWATVSYNTRHGRPRWSDLNHIQVGTSGAVQCLWVQVNEGRKCWKRYRRCHQQTGRTNKIPITIWCCVSLLVQCWVFDFMILKKWKSWNLEDSGRKEELAQFEPSSRHIRVVSI